jgi:hypothetical protein
MCKGLVTLAGSIMLAALTAAPANAAVYTYDFESFDGMLSMTGDLTVDASDDVVSMTGDISGLVDQTISNVVADPSFPGAALSPDGSFIYDNLFYTSGQTLDVDGVLFTTAQDTTGYWNLWGNSPLNYSLYESIGPGNYAIQESGTLSVASIPELSTWAMLGLGFAGLGLARLRRAPRLPNMMPG